MISDKELFQTNDNLKIQLDYAINELCNKSCEVFNKLKNFHHIYINYKADFSNLNDCEGFVDQLKEKVKEERNTKNNIEERISKILNDDEEKKNKLKSDYEMKKAELEQEVIEATKESENLVFIEEEKLQKKIEEKENLVESMNDLGQDQDLIIQNYERDELIKADSEYNKSIEELNKKYIFKNEKLEYTKEEIQLKNQYFEEIQKIKSYSENPFYDNFITSFGLNKYLN